MNTTWLTRELRMFTGAPQTSNFSRLASLMPARVLRRAETPSLLPIAPAQSLPDTFEFNNRERETEDFLKEVETVGMIVLKHGAIVHQRYSSTDQETLQWPSWSVVKSIVSCLVGIAVDDGAFTSVGEPISKYAPALVGSAYEGVPIAHVLQMCSGARWSENYADPDSDVRRNARVLSGNGSRDGLAASAAREHPSGTRHRYNSNDTHALSMALRGATGWGMTRLLQEKLWSPLGMQDDAFWLVDVEGVEWAAAGLLGTLRDFAKFGLLYLNRGKCGERPIVSEEWVGLSKTAQAAHLQRGPKQVSPGAFGYGYQWWLAPNDSDAFSAIGVYNQYIYINARAGVVIAKASANSRFGSSYNEAGYRDEEHMALFTAIADSL